MGYNYDYNSEINEPTIQNDNPINWFSSGNN